MATESLKVQVAMKVDTLGALEKAPTDPNEMKVFAYDKLLNTIRILQQEVIRLRGEK